MKLDKLKRDFEKVQFHFQSLKKCLSYIDTYKNIVSKGFQRIMLKNKRNKRNRT